MPLSGEFLLDTNIVIALFKQEEAVLTRLATAGSVMIPAVVIGELYFGAYQSARLTENIVKIQAFLNQMRILQINEHTASEYGWLKTELKRKGRPIPENDIWIAALAKQHQLTLVSRDKHMKAIETIAVEVW